MDIYACFLWTNSLRLVVKNQGYPIIHSIKSTTIYLSKVEKRRSKNIRFLNFIMQQTTVMDGVLLAQLLTNKDTCKYVCIDRTTLREMIKNKQFPSPRSYAVTNKSSLFFGVLLLCTELNATIH